MRSEHHATRPSLTAPHSGRTALYLTTLLAPLALLALAACHDTTRPPPPPPAVASVVVTPSDTTAASGTTLQLAAVATDASGHALTGRDVAWSSSDSAVAPVYPHTGTSPSTIVVVPARVGTATIIATSEGKEGHATVTVAPGPPARVSVQPASADLGVGETVHLTAIVADYGDNILAGHTVTWSSSDPAVATVDAATGLVRGVAAGPVRVWATVDQTSGSASLSVVNPLAGVTTTDLGTLGGANSSAAAINNLAQVVGTSQAVAGADTPSHAFLWTAAGGIVDLGTTALGSTTSSAAAINDRGQVVGTRDGLAFRWSRAGGVQDLGTLPGGQTSAAYGINSAGDVVGASFLTDSYGYSTLSRAFLWTEGGGMRDLGILSREPESIAHALNDSGQVVGHSFLTDYYYGGSSSRAFLWTAAGGMEDLGAGSNSEAWAINDSGEVVGEWDGHAFRWTRSGGFEDLGTLGGNSAVAYAINDSGQIVGEATTTSGLTHAFLWTRATGMHLLSSAESGARGVNDRGQVVGWMTTDPTTRTTHAVLWTLPGTLPASPAASRLPRTALRSHRP